MNDYVVKYRQKIQNLVEKSWSVHDKMRSLWRIGIWKGGKKEDCTKKGITETKT